MIAARQVAKRLCTSQMEIRWKKILTRHRPFVYVFCFISSSTGNVANATFPHVKLQHWTGGQQNVLLCLSSTVIHFLLPVRMRHLATELHHDRHHIRRLQEMEGWNLHAFFRYPCRAAELTIAKNKTKTTKKLYLKPQIKKKTTIFFYGAICKVAYAGNYSNILLHLVSKTFLKMECNSLFSTFTTIFVNINIY